MKISKIKLFFYCAKSIKNWVYIPHVLYVTFFKNGTDLSLENVMYLMRVFEFPSNYFNVLRYLEGGETIKTFQRKNFRLFKICSDLEKLKEYPKDSVGYTLYMHYSKEIDNIKHFHNTLKDIYDTSHTTPQYEDKDFEEFIRSLNSYEMLMHDIFHVVFGYDTQVIDEVKISIHSYRQLGRPTGGLVGLFYALKNKRDRKDLWNVFKQSRKTESIMQLNISTYLKKPLKELRNDFSIPEPI